ncbi:MAG TPA: ATP-binding protein [Polyangiaceae bacterium]|nr:ATP-binding protein [Polyangiaceae bacterium]
MVVFQQDLPAYPLRAVFDEAAEVLGDGALAELLAEHGVARRDFEDPLVWVSLEFVEWLFATISERIADSDFVNRAAARSMRAQYMGPLHSLVVGFGTPLFIYRQLPKMTRHLHNVARWEIEQARHGVVRLVLTPKAGSARERTNAVCRFRIAQLRRVPILFDLPSARIEHPQCMVEGADTCVYDVTWDEPRRRSHAIAGLSIGALAGVAFGASMAAPAWSSCALALALGLGGWAFGRVLMLRQDLRLRVREVDEHNHALDRVMRSNEQRFAELLEAKAEVERKVEQRTEELRRAGDKLGSALEQLQELDRAKTDFFHNVSHELRSPLTLILAPLEDMVARRQPPGGLENAYAAMQRNAQRLLHLINQLLDLAKIGAGAMKIDPAPVQLIGLLDGIVRGFEPAAAKKGIEIQLDAPETLPNVVLDASWIDSAVTNLIANAVRMTEPGGRVRIGLEDQGAEVAITVADDGPGIAPEDHKKVFERFAQGDTNKRMVGGTGLGLVLVREAARLHGGDVSLVSELGQGATFTMRLPRRPVGTASIAPPGSAPRPLTLPPRVSTEPLPDVSADRLGPAPNAPMALVVEDNAELLHFMADVLCVRYRVRAASNGREALALALQLKPDVVVSDVAMSGMDGYELCRALRAADETRQLPVLLVTARTDIASVLIGFEAGANDYVLKPFHGRELLARVDVHVRVRRMVQELALQERHAMLGVLAASVAHQVRNPLTSLVSGLPAMRKRVGPKVDAQSLELIDVMVDCAERIERLTQDLLDLSRVDREEGGKYRPSDGLQAALRLFRTRTNDGITIEDDVEPSIVGEGRVGDINHVFMNLLDNALRAIGSQGRIRVLGRMENGCYVTRIEDSGPGIDDETAQRIFEPFFTTREAGEGTGLGLAIARQVIHAAGGTIEVSRSSLGGALFTTRIPLERRVAPLTAQLSS